MHHLVDATRAAIREKNWYAALGLALAMPDMCAQFAYPELKGRSKQRVIDWFNAYLRKKYSFGPPMNITLMEGGDFYALRCAFLHEGDFSLGEHKARQVLDRFHLTAPGRNIFHMNTVVNTGGGGKPASRALQLSVDRFCEEICSAVEAWLADVALDETVQAEMATMGKIVGIKNL